MGIFSLLQEVLRLHEPLPYGANALLVSAVKSQGFLKVAWLLIGRQTSTK